MSTQISVIVLTRNEQENLPYLLRTLQGWAADVFIVDSFSTDSTVEIAGQFGAKVYRHEFEDYSKQRNWAIDNLPFRTEWTIFMDADEWLPPELKDEIAGVIASDPPESAFYLKWRLMWMGKWIKRGYYPNWILRLFRNGAARFGPRGINEYLVTDGQAGYLRNDFIHEDRKGVGAWILKHNAYAEREARELFRGEQNSQVAPKLFGDPYQQRRWLRYRFYNRMPLILRGGVYFLFRYILLGGFLDGREGFIYHFLHACWYRFLIDCRYLEMKREAANEKHKHMAARA